MFLIFENLMQWGFDAVMIRNLIQWDFVILGFFHLFAGVLRIDETLLASIAYGRCLIHVSCFLNHLDFAPSFHTKLLLGVGIY